MDERLLKPYNPKETENKIYKLWEESGFFNPDICIEKGITKPNAEAFSMVLPPPNVTGNLHTGHALMLVIEDIMVRHARMKGMKTLWLPGTDHAAIATQSKVEKLLEKEGTRKNDLGREEFLKRVEKFAQDSHDTIVNQAKTMGASLDWSREAFTLDEKRNIAVKIAFKQMYDDGLIYRGHRIVNWDPKGQTVISDDEIVYEERKAKFYTFKYGPFEIATARPETKFGDKYVVMHPDDKRYKDWEHGQKITVEWINGPIEATIIKDEIIDMEFGTGVMTITPWHSHEDFALAEKYKLEKEQIIDKYGKLLPIAEEFAGMKINDAREKIVEKLKSKGLLVSIDENYINRVATAERTGGIIEPQIMLQWFMDVNKKIPSRDNKSLKELMLEPVRDGKIKILPNHFEKVYYNWIENLHDWCISRQIWYGHRIPAWHCLSCGQVSIAMKPKNKWFLVRHGETYINQEKRHYPKNTTAEIPLNEEGLMQAEASAQELKNEKIDLIISSHYMRAQQTAQAISKITGAEIIFEEDFRERDAGDAEGMTFEEVSKKFPNFFGYNDKSANHENYQEMEERMWKAFSKYYEKYKDKNIVIVGHGGSLRSLLRKIKNINPSELREKLPALSNAKPFTLDILDPCGKCGSHFFEQDPDTLDTWFSAGLWTFSTLGWPEKTKDLTTYHPTSVLETGHDILFFWIARMILMSQYLLGEIPFKNVYLHGMIRTADGKKMSKSLGDKAIDPLSIIEKYGNDALRMAMIVGNTPGNDLKLNENDIRGYAKFANKVWNASRFVIEQIKDLDIKNLPKLDEEDSKSQKELEDLVKEISKEMDEFRFSIVAEKLYHYFWHTFADIIIERSKIKILKNQNALSAKILLYIQLTTLLKLLHPFIPFVTEEIWSMMPQKDKKLLLVEKWPFDFAQGKPNDN